MSLDNAKQSLLLSVCVSFAACSPSTQPIGAGPISLKYGGKLESEHQFDLANGSSDPIRFRGWTKSFSSPTPALSAYAISCHSGSSGEISGFAIEHGREPASIEVPPREQMRLIISSDSITTSSDRRCQLDLKLENGSIIESDEFTP